MTPDLSHDKTNRSADQTPAAENSTGGSSQFEDHRLEAITQFKFQKMLNDSPRMIQMRSIQDMANKYSGNSKKAESLFPFQQKADPIIQQEGTTTTRSNASSDTEVVQRAAVDTKFAPVGNLLDSIAPNPGTEGKTSIKVTFPMKAIAGDVPWAGDLVLSFEIEVKKGNDNMKATFDVSAGYKVSSTSVMGKTAQVALKTGGMVADKALTYGSMGVGSAISGLGWGVGSLAALSGPEGSGDWIKGGSQLLGNAITTVGEYAGWGLGQVGDYAGWGLGQVLDASTFLTGRAVGMTGAVVGGGLNLMGQENPGTAIQHASQYAEGMLTGELITEAVAKIGGSIEAEGKTSKEVMALVSYALYQQFKDLGRAGQTLANYLWSDSSKSGDQWAQDLETESMVGNNSKVSRGYYIGGEGEATSGGKKSEVGGKLIHKTETSKNAAGTGVQRESGQELELELKTEFSGWEGAVKIVIKSDKSYEIEIEAEFETWDILKAARAIFGFIGSFKKFRASLQGNSLLPKILGGVELAAQFANAVFSSLAGFNQLKEGLLALITKKEESESTASTESSTESSESSEEGAKAEAKHKLKAKASYKSEGKEKKLVIQDVRTSKFEYGGLEIEGERATNLYKVP